MLLRKRQRCKRRKDFAVVDIVSLIGLAPDFWRMSSVAHRGSSTDLHPKRLGWDRVGKGKDRRTGSSRWYLQYPRSLLSFASCRGKVSLVNWRSSQREVAGLRCLCTRFRRPRRWGWRLTSRGVRVGPGIELFYISRLDWGLLNSDPALSNYLHSARSCKWSQWYLLWRYSRLGLRLEC